MAHHLFISFSHFFRLYGYWTIFLATMLEGAGVPLPGETLLLFAGFVARTGDIHLSLTVLAAIGGSTVGECLGYLIGRLGGDAFLEAHRKRLFISTSVYERCRVVFLKNAGWAILAARFVAGFRELAGIVAGVFRMDFSAFFFYNFAGAIAWSVTMCAVGFLVGRSWRRLLHVFGHIDLAALVGFAGIVAVLVIRYWWRGRKKAGALQ
ncbi:MAG: DedA family protein [Terriglobia bacterium]